MALESPRQTTNNLSDQFLTENIPVGWPWRLLIFAVFVFALSLFTFFGLKFGYQAFLDDKLAELDRNLDALGKKVSVEEQNRFVNFYSKIVNLKSVLDIHPYPSAIFTFLEKNVVDGIYFTDLEVDIVGGTMELKGVAANFNVLAQQVAVMEESPEVDNVLVKEVGLGRGSGAANFTITANFKKGFLSKPI